MTSLRPRLPNTTRARKPLKLGRRLERRLTLLAGGRVLKVIFNDNRLPRAIWRVWSYMVMIVIMRWLTGAWLPGLSRLPRRSE